MSTARSGKTDAHDLSGSDGAALSPRLGALFYGSLADAMQIAAQHSEEVQDGLFIATDNDVVAYLDLLES